MSNDDLVTPEGDPVTFVRITNAQIYAEQLSIIDKLHSLEVKVYGIITGLIAALGFLIRQEFFPGG